MIDPHSILNEHVGNRLRLCRCCRNPWPCDTYELATELIKTRIQLANVSDRTPALLYRTPEGTFTTTPVLLYRKKPLIVHAMRFTGTNIGDINSWMYNCDGATCTVHDHDNSFYRASMLIDTLEGRMIARAGDMVMRGVKGEFYPCKPDIFAETYEIVKPDKAGEVK